MIKVCDAIMGSGKSSAAINYMNERYHLTNGEAKFIYITPYLDEATRIKEACPDLGFVEPSSKIGEYHYKKSEHTAELIERGRNIATTHQMFKRYTPEMLKNIKNKNYTLIIDEEVNILEKTTFSPTDMQILIDAGYIEKAGDTYNIKRRDYNGMAFKDLFQLLESRSLFCQESQGEVREDAYFYWTLAPELITSFKDVIVLTYMFEGQSLRYLFQMNNLPFEYIGVRKDNMGSYKFTNKPCGIPESIYDVKDKIHILDDNRYNAIGDRRTALSMGWYEKGGGNVEQLKKNMYNVMNNVWRGVNQKEKLWGCFNSHSRKIQGAGFTRSFLQFNARASNDYCNCNHLVYAVNLFMNVADKMFYQKRGIQVNDDAYALSIMVQWIWRSAIRKGEDVYIYIPSKRMRDLLVNWMDSLTEGGEDISKVQEEEVSATVVYSETNARKQEGANSILPSMTSVTFHPKIEELSSKNIMSRG